MNWNDTITIIFKRDKNKLVIPRTAIKSLGTQRKRDYSTPGNEEKEITVIVVDSDWAYTAGIEMAYTPARQETITIEVDMELQVVLALLRGDKAAEVLFNAN